VATETTAHRSEITESYATVYNGDTCGLTLGDLRKVVAAADGMPDDARLTAEALSSHYSLKDVYFVKRVSVTARSKA
jgi:hypothetical protein